MAEISSLIRRDPRSEHMAEPPAPAMIRAAVTGAVSRTTATTRAAPICELAPNCCSSEPTSREMTRPSGTAMRMSGRVQTRTRNQHCSKNSARGKGSLAGTSRARANMLPVSLTSVRTRLVPGSSPRPLVLIAMAGPPSPTAAYRPARHRSPGRHHRLSPDPATANRTTPARSFVPYESQPQCPLDSPPSRLPSLSSVCTYSPFDQPDPSDLSA